MTVIINGSNTPTAGGVTYGDGSAYATTTAGSAGGVLYSAGASAPAFTAAGSAGQYLQSAGAGVPVWATLVSTPTIVRSARTSNTILGTADASTLIAITSGTFTQTFTAAATLGSGWFCYIQNAGTGEITLDPNGSETIDGLTSYIMYPSEVRLVQCNGTAFNTVVLSPFYQAFTASGTFTKPPGYLNLGSLLWSGGSSGSRTNNTGTASAGGGGGGCFLSTFPAASLAATETITVGAGGLARTTVATGLKGGNTSLGSLITVFANNSHFNGGSVFTQLKSITPGAAACFGFEGGNGAQSTSASLNAIWGGAAAWDAAFDVSGSSIYGGGAGGGVNDVATVQGAGTSKLAGNGGAASSAGNGTDGVAPAGGGGATQTGTTSGAGGRGELRIWGIA